MSTLSLDGLSGSNSLTDLAARIRAEHTAVATALKDSVKHAIVAGELLIEAKAQVSHGQWLPWLRDHCTISERTAQLYIRVAKNRVEVEAKIRNDVADLTLSEAAAVLALSSDVRRLLRFIKEIEELDDPEDIIKACVAANIPVVVDEGYNPFAHRTETEQLEWELFTLFLSFKPKCRGGFEPQNAWRTVEWVLQRPFQNVAEWLGEEGNKFCNSIGMKPMPETFKASWAAFLTAHRDWNLTDVRKEFEVLQQQFEQARAEGLFRSAPTPKRKRRRHPAHAEARL
jgi:hypothetical protein